MDISGGVVLKRFDYIINDTSSKFRKILNKFLVDFLTAHKEGINSWIEKRGSWEVGEVEMNLLKIISIENFGLRLCIRLSGNGWMWIWVETR